ncbi:F-box protein [Frankliniella fusca]|uniref:F-box protein n=1 Tax=Frankliniella fusca TaxID=407009 RepID=A0AAE1HKL3_9NEOP|nr:F-box protein [Frankliniella fusca]
MCGLRCQTQPGPVILQVAYSLQWPGLSTVIAYLEAPLHVGVLRHGDGVRDGDAHSVQEVAREAVTVDDLEHAPVELDLAPDVQVHDVHEGLGARVRREADALPGDEDACEDGGGRPEPGRDWTGLDSASLRHASQPQPQRTANPTHAEAGGSSRLADLISKEEIPCHVSDKNQLSLFRLT